MKIFFAVNTTPQHSEALNIEGVRNRLLSYHALINDGHDLSLEKFVTEGQLRDYQPKGSIDATQGDARPSGDV